MNRRAFTARPRLAAAAMAGAAVVALAACSSGTSGTGSSSGTTAASGTGSAPASGGVVSASGLAAAKAIVAADSKDPATATVGAPLTVKPKAGLLFAYIAPPSPTVQLNLSGMQQAAAYFGDTVKYFSIGATADTEAQAFTSALAQHPAGVWVDGITLASYETYYNQMQRQGIPVVAEGTPLGNVNDKQFNYVTSADQLQLMAPMGDWAIAHANGAKVNALIVYPSGIQEFGVFASGITARIKAPCPSCAVAQLTVPITASGTTLPSEVTGYLQRNPDTNYVILELASMDPGMIQAMKTAGVYNQVTIEENAAGPAQLNELRAGNYAVDWAADQINSPYAIMDFFARSVTGQSTQPDFNWSFPKLTRFLTAQTVGKLGEPGQPFGWSGGPVSAWQTLWNQAKAS